jgi:hypothetical protein
LPIYLFASFTQCFESGLFNFQGENEDETSMSFFLYYPNHLFSPLRAIWMFSFHYLVNMVISITLSFVSPMYSCPLDG